MKWAIVLFLSALFAMISVPGEAAEKLSIGAVEEIILLPWGARLPARIDTGATTSSLDVCDIKVEGRFVSFTLSDRCGGHKVRRELVEWTEVRTTEGTERRPVVMVDICLGPKIIKTHVTLNNRSKMGYPFLVGRKTLRGKFIVDVSRKNILPPHCPGIKLDMKPAIDFESSPDTGPGQSKP